MEILPKRVIRTGLAVGVLGAFTTAIGCMTESRPTASPTNTPIPSSRRPIPPAPTIAASERIRLGALVENLDLSGFKGFTLEQNFNLDFPGVNILNASSKFNVTIDLNALGYWFNYCQVPQNYNSINVSFYDRQPSGRPGLYEIQFSTIGSSIFFAIETFYSSWSTQARIIYDISPTSRGLDNLVNLSINIRLIDGLCASSAVARLNPPLPSPALDRILDNATAEANQFEESLLTGTRPLIVAIHRVA